MKQDIYKVEYDKNYSYQSITIDNDIWTNKNIYGVAKMMMALYRKMTKNGQQDIKNMTIRQAQILNTKRKDIEYNQKRLMNSGFITIYDDAVQGEMLKFNFKESKIDNKRDNNSNSLF